MDYSNTNYSTKIAETGNKVPKAADFVKKTNLGRKISGAVTNLATEVDIITTIDFAIANTEKGR